MSRRKSAVVMGAGLMLNYFGHEFARSASLSLLLSNQSYGWNRLAFVVTAISSCFMLLATEFCYTRSKIVHGTASTLRMTCILCPLATLLFLFVAYTNSWTASLVLIYYTFRQAYVSVLSAQQWNFIVMATKNFSSSTISRYAGMVSVSCTLGAGLIQTVVAFVEFPFLTVMSAFCVICVGVCAELSYFFLPFSLVKLEKDLQQQELQKLKLSATNHRISHGHYYIVNYLVGTSSDTINLLRSNNLVLLLLLETLLRCCVTNSIHLLFYQQLYLAVNDDSYRAVLIGRIFAVIHIAASVVQALVLPMVFARSTPLRISVMSPVILVVTAVVLIESPEFATILFSFGLMKILEYSVVAAASDRCFLLLSEESRVQGKQFIGFYGDKLGKAATALLVGSLQLAFDQPISSQVRWLLFYAVCWGICAGVVGWQLNKYNLRAQSKRSDCCLTSSASAKSFTDLSKLDDDSSAVNSGFCDGTAEVGDSDYFVGEFAPGLVVEFPAEELEAIEEEGDNSLEYSEDEEIDEPERTPGIMSSNSQINNEGEASVVERFKNEEENKERSVPPLSFNMNQYGGVDVIYEEDSEDESDDDVHRDRLQSPSQRHRFLSASSAASENHSIPSPRENLELQVSLEHQLMGDIDAASGIATIHKTVSKSNLLLQEYEEMNRKRLTVKIDGVRSRTTSREAKDLELINGSCNNRKVRRKSIEPVRPAPLPFNPAEEANFPAGGMLPSRDQNSSTADFLAIDHPEFGCSIPAGKVVKVRAQSMDDANFDPYFGGGGGGGGLLARRSLVATPSPVTTTAKLPAASGSSESRAHSMDSAKLPPTMVRVGSAFLSIGNLQDASTSIGNENARADREAH